MSVLMLLGWDEFDPGFNDPSMNDDSGFMGLFVFVFILIVVIGIGSAVWRVSTARKIATRSGMDPDDATAMALLSDHGLEATYLASNVLPALHHDDPAPPPADAPAAASTADRLRELQGLLDQGLITQAEYDARRQAIIDGV